MYSHCTIRKYYDKIDFTSPSHLISFPPGDYYYKWAPSMLWSLSTYLHKINGLFKKINSLFGIIFQIDSLKCCINNTEGDFPGGPVVKTS